MLEPVHVNVGCGDYPLQGWVNIDENPRSLADIFQHVPPLPFEANSVTEIFAGHFLEHLEKAEADSFLRECFRVLIKGGQLGIVVPDMLEAMRRYVMGITAPIEFPLGEYHDMKDLDTACEILIFSTAQESRHHWAYDRNTLTRALVGAGFQRITELDQYHDLRIPVGVWYQFGLGGVKPLE